MRHAASILSLLAASSAMAQPAIQTPAPPPSPLQGLAYDAPFFPGASYDPQVPTPDSILGFTLGSRAASPAEIERVVKAIAEKSPRVRVFEYARSHEGRPLVYAVIARADRIANLEALKRDLARFADPRTVSQAEGDRLARELPLVAWMAYSIHGDEMSGADASLALLYHLAASTDADVAALLDQLVVCIDPLMNPDGRDRCVTQVRQRRAVQPDVDDQSIIHTQVWPWGRTNHYYFDMNRDWIFGTQPETRGRIAAVRDWCPQYFMESHEMGPQDSFLFMPAREPINYNYPAHSHQWGEVIAREHAAAFDRFGWRYYTGEWNESWYPGYSSTWGALRGAIEQLYEQAHIDADAVRKGDRTLETYRESVHHQLVSSWANLKSLEAHRAGIMGDYLAEKRANVAPEGRFASRVFVIPPTPNAARLNAFLDLMALQGIEVLEASAGFSASGVDRLGQAFENRAFPAGSFLIPTRQPLANLVAALLEFDPQFKDEFLTEERRELLRFDQSRLYDTTAWNLTMMQDLPCVEVKLPALPDGRSAAIPAPAAAPADAATQPTAYIASAHDDRSVALAGRLMERGVWVRVCNKPIRLDGRDYPRGSVLVLRNDNKDVADWARLMSAAATELALRLDSISSGLGPGDFPDIGGEHFVLLQPPRVAVLSQAPFSPNSVGEVWHMLDRTLGLRASFINFDALNTTDLRRYNVIILPDGAGPDGLKDKLDALRAWTTAGGTLVALGQSADALAREQGIGSVRRLSDVLTKLDDYRLQVIREYQARIDVPARDLVYSRTPPPKLDYPWTIDDSNKPSDDEAKRRDAWRRVFAPQGVILAARVDDRHWLTSGCGEMLPVLYQGPTVLMSGPGVDAPLRLGVFVDSPPKPDPAPPADAKDKKDDKPPPPGWTVAPPGHDLLLRLSGLLWPEAANALANAPFVTRESIGRGQVILFASNPATRAATTGTLRVLENAVVFGPGMGASQPLRLEGR